MVAWSRNGPPKGMRDADGLCALELVDDVAVVRVARQHALERGFIDARHVDEGGERRGGAGQIHHTGQRWPHARVTYWNNSA